MKLEDFFKSNPSGALAFSGGTDSCFLLWAAQEYGENWHAYYVKTAFQPEFELADVRKIASKYGMPLTIIQGDILKYPEIAENPSNRCYLCKNVIFSMIQRQAKADCFDIIIDGTNASDDPNERPGMRAIKELGIRSPLRECGLTKSDIRELSREADLFTWNKPSYSCLATRIPTGIKIDLNSLEKVERGENLLSSLGFTNFRIRLRGSLALLQFTNDQLAYAFERKDDIKRILQPIFPIVAIDLQTRNR